jgi:hypothetical protein
MITSSRSPEITPTVMIRGELTSCLMAISSSFFFSGD